MIIHGDHNTRFDLDPTRPSPADGEDVLPVLLAIHWADGGLPGQPMRSLVNVYREIFRRYFGARLAHLPDRGYLVSFDGAYRFIPASGESVDRVH